jgi:hypothetical protein
MKVIQPAISLVTLCLVALLSGCSTTTVHLHANGVPEADKENIRAGLEAKGFAVLERDNEAPSKDNAILYAPYKGLEKDLHAIENVLANNGVTAGRSFAIQTDQLGKHEYTAGNIGLYIVPSVSQLPAERKSKVRAEFPITITDAEFVSTNCETEYGFQFSENGTLAVDDFTREIDATEIAKPDWSGKPDNIVFISNGNEQFEYKKSESHFEHVNEYNIHLVTYNIWLEPVEYYRVPFGCTYRSTYTEAP